MTEMMGTAARLSLVFAGATVLPSTLVAQLRGPDRHAPDKATAAGPTVDGGGANDAQRRWSDPQSAGPRVALAAEQLPGSLPGPCLIASFDGLGSSFNGPQGQHLGRSPSDNSLAVGPDHVVQIVNSRMAVSTDLAKSNEVR